MVYQCFINFSDFCIYIFPNKNESLTFLGLYMRKCSRCLPVLVEYTKTKKYQGQDLKALLSSEKHCVKYKTVEMCH